MSQDLLHSVVINTGSADGAFIEEMLPCLDFFPTSYFDRQDDFASLNLYFDDADEAQKAKKSIQNSLCEWTAIQPINLDRLEILYSEIQREDWAEKVKTR